MEIEASGNTNQGNWTVGPTLVSPGVGWDEPAAMMVDGKVLFQTVLGPPQNPQPRGFYEMDPTSNYPVGTITETPEWGDTSGTSHIMLNLPDGNVLVSYGSKTVRVYQPDGVPVAAGKPTVASISLNADGSFHLTGIQLNGISQGSSFGDDAQMDSNYPLVRMIAQSGEVTYARTFNWSSTGVQTANRVVSTEFVLPAVLAGTGPFSLEVVANGIASDPKTLPLVLPGETQTFSGNSSMGTNDYEIRGGITTFQDDGSASGILLRGPGGTIQLLDSATADTATISVDGGMGNGGIPAYLRFMNNSTAAAATILNRGPVLGPNFKNVGPNPDNGWGGTTEFNDNAAAGTAHILNQGEDHANASNGATGGITRFSGSASAEHATLEAWGSPVNGTGGYIEFSGSSTASRATFLNLNGSTGATNSCGHTAFFDTATAGYASFTNIGGAGGFLEAGGITDFRGNSTADHATFTSYGGTGGNFPGPGVTRFFDYTTASNATFINRPGYGSGGNVIFYGHSTAATGTFINDSTGTVVGGAGGNVYFKEDSTAGQGSFTTTGYNGGYVWFRDRTRADYGTFLIDSNVYDGRIEFYETASADHGMFEIGGGGYIQFYGSSTASNATIVLHANGTAGKSSYGTFSDNATPGNAAITVMGTEVPGMYGAGLSFQGPATAGNATITVNGASVTTFGASGGYVGFFYGAGLGTARIIANGGTNGGAGASIRCNGAPADQAQIILNAGATLDVAGAADTHVGSLEGAGDIWIDHSLLAIGALNTDTMFSGVISGRTTPPLGAFTKEGIGALTLAGTNTFKGLTTVAAGTLVVNGSLASDVQVNGGATLRGANNISGNVTVLPGGIVAPGNGPGTLTIGGDYSQQAGGMLEIEVAGPSPQNQDHLIVKGNVNLSGRLLLVLSGYAPSAADSFTLVEAGGALNVSNLEIVVLGLKPGYQPTYQVSDGKLTLTATMNGQLRGATDPMQALAPSFTPQPGFVIPVFAIAGATYRFDTSTNLKTWTLLYEIPGANALVEFRNIPAAGESRRFYRVVQKSGTP